MGKRGWSKSVVKDYASSEVTGIDVWRKQGCLWCNAVLDGCDGGRRLHASQSCNKTYPVRIPSNTVALRKASASPGIVKKLKIGPRTQREMLFRLKAGLWPSFTLFPDCMCFQLSCARATWKLGRYDIGMELNMKGRCSCFT